MTPTERYHNVLQRIHAACASHQRSVADIRLLAVSKGQPPERIRELYALGQREFGENYRDELVAKAGQLRDLDIKWVYIGQLQSNKIKSLMTLAHEIQTVSHEKHVRYLAQYAPLERQPFPVYIAINIGREVQKAGVLPEALTELIHVVEQYPKQILLEGLMAIPPVVSDTGVSGAEQLAMYKQLRVLAPQVGVGKLSLGMSQDLELAIASGSSCVRVGTDLFGPRL